MAGPLLAYEIFQATEMEASKKFVGAYELFFQGPPKPPCFPKAPPDALPRGQSPQTLLTRKRALHERRGNMKSKVTMERNMMSNHTDMQDKYCGRCYDDHPIQSQYKGNRKRAGAAVRPGGGGQRPAPL